MNPIIYKIPNITYDVKFDLSKSIRFSNNLNPQLIKYGYNLEENDLNISELVENKYYHNGIVVDYEEIVTKLALSKKITLSSIQLIEILKLFNFNNMTCHSNVSVLELKDVNITLNTTKKKTYDLIIHLFSTSEINTINENTFTVMIIKQLHELFKFQTKGSSMILQLGEIKTIPMVQLIYFLSSSYENSYLIKPMTSVEISSESYIILDKLINEIKFPEFKNSKNYIDKLYDDDIPEVINNTIKYFNLNLTVLKLNVYFSIKKYLDDKVYEGDLYQKIKKQREEMIKFWSNTFIKGKNLDSYLESLIKQSDKLEM